MADPTTPNPTGAGGPPSGLDPGTANQMEGMMEALREANRVAGLSEEHLKAMAEHAKNVTKNLDKEKLSFIVGLFDKVENKLAEINRFTKKFVHEIRNIKDTKEAKEQIEDMVKAMKDALASQKSFSVGAAAIRRQIGDWEKALSKFGDEARDLTTGEMRDLTNLAERTAKAGKDFSSSIKKSEIGKLGDFIRGATTTRRKGYVPELREQWGAMKEAYQAPRLARMAATEGGAAGGVMDKVMDGVVDAIEGGVGALEVGMEALSGPLGWLAIAVEALIAVFDKYVKQNKDMEAKLAKGGLFTGSAMLDRLGGTTLGGEDAFARTRRALTPSGLGLNELGITWQRNLDIAAALTEGGYGIKSMLGEERLADARPITTGVSALTSGFAGGGFGQVQRIVTGIGRVLGMTDVEGVQEVLKMLEQYSQTLDSTEKFLAQIEKDTDAAGISTTKYLKIIDEVSGHFNKMNKEINQTLGIMRELGRSGAVSSEILKDMMEFLTTETKPDVGGISEDIYALTQETTENRKAVIKATDAGVDKQLDAVRGQVADINRKTKGGTGIEIPTINLGEGGAADFAKAVTQVDKLELDTKTALIGGKISKAQAQMIDQSVQSLRESITAAGNARSDAYGQAAGRAAGIVTPAGTAALNLTKVRSAAQQWGINVSDLVSGTGAFGPGASSTAAIGFLKQLSEIYHMDPAETRRRFAETMTERTTNLMVGGDDQARLDAQALTKEVFTKWKAKGAVPNYKWLRENGITQVSQLDALGDDTEKVADFLRHTPKMAGELEDTNGLLTQVVTHAADQFSVSDTELALELDKARKIGRQTQSVADAVGAVFSKWLTKIISWLEYIAGVFEKVYSKIPGVKTMKEETAERQDSFDKMSKDFGFGVGAIPDKMAEISEEQIKLEQKNKNVPMTQWSDVDQEQYKKLDDIAGHLKHVQEIMAPELGRGQFESQDEMDEAMKATKELSKAFTDLAGTLPPMTSIDIGNSPYLRQGQGPTTIDNSNTQYIQGDVKQNFQTPNTVGKTASESPLSDMYSPLAGR